MKRIVEFFVKYPIWANTIIFLTIVFGIFAFTKTNRSFFPEREPHTINVTVSYPGASPEEMEEGVTIKIENALEGIDGIDELTSTSRENYANIEIEIDEYSDIDEVLTDVKNAVDRVNNLPDDAENPSITKRRSTQRAAFLALSGDVNPMQLKKAAEDIKDDLMESDEISQVEIFGEPVPELSVEVDQAALVRHGIAIDDIVNAIRMNNRDISAGTIQGKEEEILIRSRARSVDPDKIEDIIVLAFADGRSIKVSDIANVKLQQTDTPNKSLYKGNLAISLTINKLTEEDLAAISKYLNEYVDEFNEKNDRLELLLRFDFNTVLNKRIGMLTKNGVIGIFLVLLTLGIFLNARLSFWVAWGIPMSFLGMFIVMSLSGITINMMTLFGMILIVGILVDDGIVIAENIYTHFESGKSAYRAAIDGSVEIIPAVFTSVTTTIIAFSPLLMIRGMSMMQEVGIVVIAALTFSLLEAFFILPSHLSSRKVLHQQSAKGNKKGLSAFVDKKLEWTRKKIYGKALDWLLRYRWVTITMPIFFMMIIFGLLGGGIIRSTFFPQVQFDDLAIDIAFIPGEREEKVERYLRDFEKKVWDVREEIIVETGDTVIEYTVINIGRTENLGESGSHAGHLSISIDIEGKDISSFEIANRIKRKIGPVPEIEKFQVGGRHRWGKPVSIGIQARDYTQLENAKELLKEKLEEISELKDVSDNLSTGRREILLKLKPKAHFLGLNHYDITKQIRSGFYGTEVQRLIKDIDEIKLWVRFPEESRQTIGQLERLKIKARDGNLYPLSELAEYDIERGVVSINHYDRKREIRIEADLKDPLDAVPPIIEKIRESIEPEIKAMYPDIEFSYKGQRRRASMMQDSLRELVPFALLAIFIVIALNFRSYGQAVLVLLFVPLGMGAAALGHAIEGLPISMISIQGIVALSGVIINDAIVLIDQFNRFVKNGMTVKQAAHEAGIMRFRPIILTSVTTVAGLFPLIRETDFQAQFVIPMAVSMAYGVLFGTIFILLWLPSIIMVFNDLRQLWCKLWHGECRIPRELEPAMLEKKKLEKRLSAENSTRQGQSYL
ncbi:MAG: efflux RND transporter permease subunit [Candidatus Zixiibacteriota bacterium]